MPAMGHGSYSTTTLRLLRLLAILTYTTTYTGVNLAIAVALIKTTDSLDSDELTVTNLASLSARDAIGSLV